MVVKSLLTESLQHICNELGLDMHDMIYNPLAQDCRVIRGGVTSLLYDNIDGMTWKWLATYFSILYHTLSYDARKYKESLEKGKIPPSTHALIEETLCSKGLIRRGG